MFTPKRGIISLLPTIVVNHTPGCKGSIACIDGLSLHDSERLEGRSGEDERAFAADGEGDAPLAVRPGAVDGDDPADTVLRMPDGGSGPAGGAVVGVGD